MLAEAFLIVVDVTMLDSANELVVAARIGCLVFGLLEENRCDDVIAHDCR